MASNIYSVIVAALEDPNGGNYNENLSTFRGLFDKTEASPSKAALELSSGSVLGVLPAMVNDGNIALTFFKAFAVYTVAALLLYVGAVVIYRLYLSPLSHFPGPFLAKVTNYYEWYYNVIQNGTYWLRIEEIHKQYGMIYSRTCCK